MRVSFFWLSLSAAHIHLAIASAAAQFHLNPTLQISDCFLECHQKVLTLIYPPTSPLAIPQAITGNCQSDPYIASMSACIVDTCISAPDAAYAIEFGRSFCARAGVNVEEKLVLPDSYTQGPAAAYFQSQAYLTSSATRKASPLLLSFAPVASVLYWIFETSGVREDGDKERIRMMMT